LIQRQHPLEDTLSGKIYYGDLQIDTPNKKKVYLIEEKNIPFNYLKKSLKTIYGTQFCDINFDSKNWSDLFQIYKRIFHENTLFPPVNEVINDLNIEIYMSKTDSIMKKKFSELLDDAKKQIEKYASALREKPEYENSTIKKFVVIRCGPSKLFGYDL